MLPSPGRSRRRKRGAKVDEALSPKSHVTNSRRHYITPLKQYSTVTPTITYQLSSINMTMLGVMTGAVNVGAVFSRLLRKVHSDVVDTDSTPDTKIITPRAVFFSEHRSCKSHIPFYSLDVSSRKDFYGNII
jgi:hypothetical protein